MQKIIGYGLFTWLIPFLAAFPFYSREGDLLIDMFLFKTIMLLVGSLIGGYMLYRYFRLLKDNFIRHAWQVGSIWVILNLLLDMIVVVPMSGMSLVQYFQEIGLRYLIILIWALSIGYLLAFHTRKS